MNYFRQINAFFASILAVILLTVSAQPVFAVSVPDFPSCLNPQVSAAQVNTGTEHGVVGKNTPYSGVDKIYFLQNSNVLQCLCTNDGAGIQTNWIKANGFSQNDINSLIAQGWTYIPTGATWGLEDVAYLAKNIEYSCKGSQPTPTPSVNGVQAAAAVVQPGVLGLATTGNAVVFYGFILAGLFSLIIGLLLKKVSK